MEVDIFIPCFIDQFYPETGFNMIKILEKLNVKTHYSPQQVCCGQFAYNNGYWEDAKSLGKKFIKEFSNNRMIIGPSASCIGYIRNYYSELFFNTALHNEAKTLQSNIFEFTDFLVNKLNVESTNSCFPHKVTYHDSCSALREYKLKDQPRKLLSNVKDLQLIEMVDNDVCCGFGGTFSVKHNAIATAMAEQKVRNAIATKAEYITSTDLSCLMHLDAYIKKHNIPLKVIHIIDILAQGI
ncbi:MAG: (Fe-S)-binding protein [Hyphomicrobiales bacterium]